MRVPSFALLSGAMMMSLLVGCTGNGGGESSSTVAVTVQASFQKRVLTPTGYGSTVTLPSRYCYATFYDSSSNQQVSIDGQPTGGFLDANGVGTFQVPAGGSIYAGVLADWEVPGATTTSPYMEGHVVNATYGTAFANTSDWGVTSDSFSPTSDGTLQVVAQDDANRIAGAFNIADQGVTFAQGMQSLAPTTPLPSVAMYWSISTNPNNQTRVYPNAIINGGNLYLFDGRAVFQAAVNGNASGAANTEQDEWDDGTLGETYAHLLFAPYSAKPDGSSGLSYLRGDIENVPYISLPGPSEPSMAFMTGFSDYLAAAFRNDPVILDSYVDGSGTFQIQDEDLTQPFAGGEFSRYAVAGSLWSMQQALGSGGLQTLWNAAQTDNPSLDSVGDYNGAPLGCYPTYLVGLRATSGIPWSTYQAAFGTWGVSDPSATYFTGASLWTDEAVPFTVNGAGLYTYPIAQNRFYDQSGAVLYRFTQGTTGNRTITMTPTDGQDFEVDLLGTDGLVASSYATPFGGTRTLNLTNLPPGDYVIRVRTNPDSTINKAAGTYHYNLALT